MDLAVTEGLSVKKQKQKQTMPFLELQESWL